MSWFRKSAIPRSRKRGLSPVLSVIILIAIAVVGGVFLNQISRDAIVRAFQSSEIKVTNISLDKDSPQACYFTLSMLNSGTKALSNMSLRVTNDFGDHVSDENLTVNMPAKINPGNKAEETAVFSGNMCGNFTTSNSYSFRINATADDGSTFATTKLVTVSEPISSGG